jgi:23S rRNA (adenine2503-C2)-methyltransferase
MGPRRITVSTVGLVPGIRRLGEDFAGRIGLAVSLHAPDDTTRNRLVPINARFPIAEVLAALREYPLPRRRRITVEYTLIQGINHSPSQAWALAKLLRGLPVKINLIPMNDVQGLCQRAPSFAETERFRQILVDAGYSCFLRVRRGDDVAAACGQLALAGQMAKAVEIPRPGGATCA